VSGETLAKRIVWLAWQASHVFGMGAFQARNSVQDEDSVWASAVGSHDYPVNRNQPGEVRCDYVQGRMMKLYLRYDENDVIVPTGTPRPDYQSWAGKYPTYEALFDAARQSLTQPIGV
jgi:hypothetical protein